MWHIRVDLVSSPLRCNCPIALETDSLAHASPAFVSRVHVVALGVDGACGIADGGAHGAHGEGDVPDEDGGAAAARLEARRKIDRAMAWRMRSERAPSPH